MGERYQIVTGAVRAGDLGSKSKPQQKTTEGGPASLPNPAIEILLRKMGVRTYRNPNLWEVVGRNAKGKNLLGKTRSEKRRLGRGEPWLGGARVARWGLGEQKKPPKKKKILRKKDPHLRHGPVGRRGKNR